MRRADKGGLRELARESTRSETGIILDYNLKYAQRVKGFNLRSVPCEAVRSLVACKATRAQVGRYRPHGRGASQTGRCSSPTSTRPSEKPSYSAPSGGGIRSRESSASSAARSISAVTSSSISARACAGTPLPPDTPRRAPPGPGGPSLEELRRERFPSLTLVVGGVAAHAEGVGHHGGGSFARGGSGPPRAGWPRRRRGRCCRRKSTHGMPYISGQRRRSPTECWSTRVPRATWLFWMTKIAGTFCTAARLMPSWHAAVLVGAVSHPGEGDPRPRRGSGTPGPRRPPR